eukprot:TRINITY_DN9202_c0_g1_i1.p1 TRINITY_DN9202_c0_g1~~TRINITY_DN9202_c0_g1_i1.p1  ORF type:complete len:217 (+),score=32.65 TRINITY_DN9202_c0_g1_i1:50-700(+)
MIVCQVTAYLNFLLLLLFSLVLFFFFFNDTATTEIYTLHIVGSVRCVQETDAEYMDPRMARTRKEEALAEATARLQLAAVTAQMHTMRLVSETLVTRAQVTLATKRRDRTVLLLEAARLRFAAKAITAQELALADEELARAGAVLDDAVRRQQAAIRQATDEHLVSVDAWPSVPPLPLSVLSIERHPEVVNARCQLKDAERALALAQGPDTPCTLR